MLMEGDVARSIGKKTLNSWVKQDQDSKEYVSPMETTHGGKQVTKKLQEVLDGGCYVLGVTPMTLMPREIEVITWAQLKIHHKTIDLLNMEGIIQTNMDGPEEKNALGNDMLRELQNNFEAISRDLVANVLMICILEELQIPSIAVIGAALLVSWLAVILGLKHQRKWKSDPNYTKSWYDKGAKIYQADKYRKGACEYYTDDKDNEDALKVNEAKIDESKRMHTIGGGYLVILLNRNVCNPSEKQPRIGMVMSIDLNESKPVGESAALLLLCQRMI
ncbi:hypothetical protein L1987_45138 [Smallanthus sonchifolius]|uniref:Uncharacterized protein n=1 Tax=Smallanthus sonchifolius TaxID=185202 RepID=A0ACB9GSK8_9ASTR|nr:hypothetical protein L1987_45138 [Smallanthus sonchifolius]